MIPFHLICFIHYCHSGSRVFQFLIVLVIIIVYCAFLNDFSRSDFKSRKGNWVEDFNNSSQDATQYFPTKEANIDYKKLKPQKRSQDFGVNKLKSLEGFGVNLVIKHDSHAKCGNYTTTNDLVYNHLPKPLCGPMHRYYRRCKHQFYPQPDLMKCYGDNLTQFGLREEKMLEWKFGNVSDYISSLYEDTYTAHRPDQYLKAGDRKAVDSSFTKTFRYKMTKPLTKPKKK